MSRSHATIGDAQAVRPLNVTRTVANGLDKAHRSAMRGGAKVPGDRLD
jgi:hypothetical protein